jgi:hypothetical protein
MTTQHNNTKGILALVSLALVPPLITKPPPQPMTPAAAAEDTAIRRTATLPTLKAEAGLEGQAAEPEEGEEFSAATDALPIFDESKDESIESVVEQPLLRLYRELSTG